MRLVTMQNLTIKLPAETIRKAKIVAAQRSTSISALVIEKIEELVGEDAEYPDVSPRDAKALREWKALGVTI